MRAKDFLAAKKRAHALLVLATTICTTILGFAVRPATAAPLSQTPTAWTMYALTPGHNARYESAFPAVSWRFAVPGAEAITHSVVHNPTVIRDILGFPIGAAVVDGVVYAPNDNGYLYAVDALTGHLRWQYNAYNQIMTTPLVVDVGGVKSVYVGAGNSVFSYSHAKRFDHDQQVVRGTGISGIFALNAHNGQLRWFYPTAGQDMPTPVFYHGKIIFGNGDGHVYALDAATGHLLWKSTIRSFVSMSSASLAEGSGTVVMGGTHPSRIYAVDANTGKLLWSVRPANVFSSSAGDGTWAIYHGVAIGQIEARPPHQAVGTSSSEEVAIDVKSGKILWTAVLGTGKVPPRNKDAVPTVAGGVVYTGSPVTHTEYALRASDGGLIWKKPLGVPMKAAPTVLDGVLIQPTGPGKIFTLDRANGEIEHVYESHHGGYGPQNGVAIGATFVIGTNKGWLQAIPLAQLRR